MLQGVSFKSPLHQMTQTTADVPVERFGRRSGTGLLDRSRCRRARRAIR